MTTRTPRTDKRECRQGYSVEELFCCAYAPYFWQAIQIRYPGMRRITRNCTALLEEQTNVESQIDGYEERYYMVRKILKRNPKIEVTEFSNLYPNKGDKEVLQSLCGSKQKET